MKKTLSKITKLISTQQYLIDTDDCSLLNGICGLAIYNLHAGRFLGDSTLSARGAQLLENIEEKLETGNINMRIFHSYSYGLAGIAYTYWHLNHYKLMDTDQSAFEGTEELLIDSIRNDFSRNITDNLHGPLGIVHYLNKKAGNASADKLILQIIDLYDAKSKKDEQGIRITNSILRDAQPEEYNLSWSHGLSGNLKLFSDSWAAGLRHPILLDIIDKGIKYIAHAERKETPISPANSHYPTSVIERDDIGDEEKLSQYKARLAWCYGDLNIAFLYLHLSKVFERPDYYEKGVSIAKNTLHRRTIKEAQVLDVFLCHGTSGLAYLYLKLYRLTNEKIFLEQADHWYDITIDRIENDFDNILTETPNSLLEGFPGLALVLMARLSEEEMGWDDIFFLTF